MCKVTSLPINEVHIWQGDLNQPTEKLQQHLPILSLDERERVSRFYFDKHRKHFVVCRGQLRTILSLYLNIDPREIRFWYGPQGKPYIASEQDNGVRFNLSHANGIALYAVTMGSELGIDFEQIRCISDLGLLAKQILSSEEAVDYDKLPSKMKPEALMRCWVRKEAYLKATGEGMIRSLRHLSVTIDPRQPNRIIKVIDRPGEELRWSLQDVQTILGCVATLCIEGQRLPIKYLSFQSS